MATQWYQAIHATKRFRLGTEKKDISGNRYVYLPGVASLAAGDWVTYNAVSAASAPVRLVDDVAGPVAIAQAANILATTFSWFLVFGNYTGALCIEALTAGDILYVGAGAGSVDDDAVAGDFVFGAVVTAAGATATTCSVFISNPFVNSGYTT